MIARPKISRNEWKTAELGAFEVGNFAPFCCPGESTAGYKVERRGIWKLRVAEASTNLREMSKGEQRSEMLMDRARKCLALGGAARESEIPNFKGSYLGRFPLVSADFWTSDHLSELSRRVDVFLVTRARGTLTLKRR